MFDKIDLAQTLSDAKVVFPAPLGPAMIVQTGEVIVGPSFFCNPFFCLQVAIGTGYDNLTDFRHFGTARQEADPREEPCPTSPLISIL